jgi:hypothetical protein
VFAVITHFVDDWMLREYYSSARVFDGTNDVFVTVIVKFMGEAFGIERVFSFKFLLLSLIIVADEGFEPKFI